MQAALGELLVRAVADRGKRANVQELQQRPSELARLVLQGYSALDKWQKALNQS